MIKNREEIPKMLSADSIGCELGVFLCEYSEVLLSSGKFSKLYLVDTFYGNIGSGDKSGNNMKNFDGEFLFMNAKNKFQNNETVEVLKKDSLSFLASCPSNYFDFIYIDTVHTYEHLIQELEESQRVIKPNGFICGHDYNNDVFPGVVKAVNDFCSRHNLTFIITSADILESFIIKQ